MEGPSIRRFPRMSLGNPIDLRVGERTIRIENPVGNLSVGGLFVHTEDLPVDTHVHVKIDALHPIEADGVVRFCEPRGEGLGIEFTAVTEANHKYLDELIAELTLKGVLAS